MITNELKQRIVDELADARQHFGGSDAKFATSVGINNAQYSRIKNGDTEQVLSEAKWITLARRLNVSLRNAPAWKTVETPVFQFITTQLAHCQQEGLSSLLCDLSDIGKSYAAKHYARTHKNAVYVDCSQVKTKQKLVRYIAREFGVGSTGRYADVYEDLVYYMRTIVDPIVILDEAGDLNYDAFLETKAMWNATEGVCAWYMMGADGLQEKMRRAIDSKKVGYTELFSRFGKKYGNVVPQSLEERTSFLQSSATMIIKANAKEGVNVGRILNSTLGDDGMPSLRRIHKELTKAC